MTNRSLLVALAMSLLPAGAKAATNVPAGNLVGPSPVTWTTAGSPYILTGDVTIPPGMTLNIDGGVVVQFKRGDTIGGGENTSRAELRVSGALNVNGTRASAVSFTSGEAAPAVGDWYGIVALAGSSVNIAGADIRYATRGLYAKGATGAQLADSVVAKCTDAVYADASATLTLSSDELANNANRGLYAASIGASTWSALKVHHNGGSGVQIDNASATITSSLIYDNAGRGISVGMSSSGTNTVTVTGNTLVGNGGYGIYLQKTTSSGTLTVPMADNIVVNNGSYGIYFDSSNYWVSATSSNNLVWGQSTNHSGVSAGSGTIIENPLFADESARDLRITSNSPARRHATGGADIGALPWDGTLTGGVQGHLYSDTTWSGTVDVLGDVTVEPAVTLTVSAGTTVRFAANADSMGGNAVSNRSELRVLGSLSAVGTAASPIVFNANGASAPAWAGIYFVASSGASTLDYVTIREATNGISSDAPNTTRVSHAIIETNGTGVLVTSGTLGVSASTIRRNTGYGISVTNGSPSITNSVIHDNGGRGISVSIGATGTNTVAINHNTIVSNGGYGIYLQKTTFAGSLTVPMTDNLVVRNGSYGIYYDSSNYSISATSTYNLVWGHSTNHSGVAAGTGVNAENPLFVDEAGRDLRLTSNSPARQHASGGSDMGALAWDGVLTVGVQGHLYADTTWSGVVDVLGDVTVEPGVTLTIAPGAAVRFAANADSMAGNAVISRTELRVLGILIAAGTPSAGVVLDANGATSPAWAGLYLLPGSGPSLVDYAVVREATNGLTSDAANTTQVMRSTFERNGTGVLVTSGGIGLTDLTVRNNSAYGVSVTNGSPTISDSKIYDNGGRGISVSVGVTGTNTVTIKKNTLVANGGHGVYLQKTTSAGSLSVPMTDNIVVNNGSYGIYYDSSNYGISATSTYNLVWGQSSNHSGIAAGTGAVTENPLFVNEAGRDLRITSNSPARKHASDGTDIGALPYDGTSTGFLAGHLYDNLTLTVSGSPYLVTGDLTVERGVTLTIQPGVTVRFASRADVMGGNSATNRTELRVLGTLVADATQSSGIVLQSDAATPAAGDWYGVQILPGSGSSFLDYVTVRHASVGVVVSGGTPTVQRSVFERNTTGIQVDSGTVPLTQLTVRNNTGYGVSVTNGSPTISDSMFYDNGGRGISVSVSVTGTNTVTIKKNTLVANGGHGVYLQKTTSGGSLSVPMTDNIVVNNGSYGIYYDSGNYGIAATSTYNLVWGQSSNHSGIAAGTGAVTENPLFVNENGRDLRITSNSPARKHASDGTDIGALAYDNASPTVGVQGHYYVDTTWSGRVDVLGDVTVEPGIKLTVADNADVRFASQTDSMAGNAATNRSELRVLGNLVVQGSASGNVKFRSAAATPARGDWWGIYLAPGATATSIGGALVQHAQNCISSDASAGAQLSRSELTDCSASGLSVTAGALVSDGVRVHHNGGYGVSVGTASPTFKNMVVYANGGRGFSISSSAGSSATVAIQHSTIVANGGHGVYLQKLTSSGSLTMTLANSIVANNGSYGVYYDTSNYLATATLKYNDVFGQTTNLSGVSGGTGALSISPLFVDGPAFNYRLQPSSPCIDAADPASTVTTDIDGVLRPLDGGGAPGAVADIGAYEYNPNANKYPTASAGPDRTVTAGAPATFDASASSDPDGTLVDYAWDFGDGTPVAHGVIVQHTFVGGANRVVTLTVTDNDGASATATVRIKVNLPPIAKAGPEKYEDANVPVLFSAAGSSDPDGNIVSYAWDFGDQSGTASGVSVSHTYVRGGDYVATLTVTDNDGATATDTTLVHVLGPQDLNSPTITHTPIANGQAEGQGVTITATVTDESGVAGVKLYYRTQGAATFTQLAMAAGASNTYSATIPSSAIALPAVQYYLEATDTASPANTGVSPSGAPGAPYTFTVKDATAPIILHTPVADGQVEGQPVTVTATVTDNASVASVLLYYRIAGTGTFASLTMSASGPNYGAQLPAAAVRSPAVEYYIEAKDGSSNTARNPAGAPTSLNRFTVYVADTAAPSIVHTPIAASQTEGRPVSVVATITDPSGVASAKLYYRTRGSTTFTQLAMTAAGSTYSAQIPAAAVKAPGADYYLEATDQASPANTGTSPAGGASAPYSFTVVPDDPPVIAHTPIANGRAVGQAVTVEATITDDVGVASATLYYRTTGTSTFTSTAMVPGAVDSYSAQIPGPAVTVAGVDYYLEAKDAAGNKGSSPSSAPASVHTFTVALAVQLNPGDLLITEIMNNPSGMENDREWFEVYNATNSAIDLQGLTFADNGTDTFTVTTSVVVQARGYAVLGRLADKMRNGNVHLDYEYGSKMSLANTADAIVIMSPSTEIDRVEYGIGFPYAVDGKSMTLDPASFSLSGNDDAANWCSAKTLIAGGVDYGTPGAANDPCIIADTAAPTIVHTPIADGQMASAAVTVSATVTDGSGVASASLSFRVAGSGDFLTAAMVPGGNDVWTAQIPAWAVTVAGIEYYLTAVDAAPAANTAVLPSTAPATPYHFTVTLADTSGPSISHVPHATTEIAGTPVQIDATITDASGLASATLFYRTRGGTWANTALTAGSADSFSATIPGAVVQPPGVEYYLTAVDGSPAANASQLPEQGAAAPFTFVVKNDDGTAPVIAHTPIANDQPAGEDVAVAAQVTDEAGVASVQVFYRATGAATWRSAAMTATGKDYAGTIPASAVVPPSIEYYLEAVDGSDRMNVARDPSDAPAVFHTFTVAEQVGDTTPPTIVHEPIADGVALGAPVLVEAQVTDASGISSVEIFARTAGTTDFVAVAMSRAGDTYSAEIPGDLLTADGVEYFLKAVDNSKAKNAATSPDGAPSALHSFLAAGGTPDAGPVVGPRTSGCGCSASGAPLSAVSGLVLLLGLFRRRK